MELRRGKAELDGVANLLPQVGIPLGSCGCIFTQELQQRPRCCLVGGKPAVGPGGPKASLLPLPSPLAPSLTAAESTDRVEHGLCRVVSRDSPVCLNGGVAEASL